MSMFDTNLSRRQALIGTGLMLSASNASAGRAAAAPGIQSEIRAAIMLAPNLLYFNNANVGPMFSAGLRAQQAAELDFITDPSFENREQYSALASRVRAAIGRRLTAGDGEIAILRNASEANAVVAQGLSLTALDEVVVTDHNHDSNLESWRQRAAREGFSVKVAVLPSDPASRQDVLDAVEKVVTPRTRVLAVSHMSNVNGLILPVHELAQMARAQGAWFHLDAAQTLGWMPLNVIDLDCDSLTGSGQKWLMGPPGTGVLYVRAARQDRLAPMIASLNYWSSNRAPPLAEKFERVGQRADASLAAMEAVLQTWERFSPQDIETGVRSIGDSLRRALAQIGGITIAGVDKPELYGPIVLAQLDRGRDPRAVQKSLWSRHRISGAGVALGSLRGCRLSPHIYTRPDEIESLSEAFKNSTA